jgi:hypothetical protein
MIGRDGMADHIISYFEMCQREALSLNRFE